MLPNGMTIVKAEQNANNYHCNFFTWSKGLVQILGKEYNKAVYCHPAYLTSMQNTSCEMLDWMNHKLESKFPGEIATTPDMQMIPL